MKETKRLVLVDAHPLMYRSFHSPGTRNLKTSTGLLSGGFFGFLRSYLALRKRLNPAFFVFCFDSGRSWRNNVFPKYKTHAEHEKPTGFFQQLDHVREFLSCIGVPVYMEPMLEADDLISIFSCGWIGKYASSIIVSSDRDFFQLICKYTMVYDDRAKKFYGHEDIESIYNIHSSNFLYYKCLIGDTSDKIPGVPGFGPVKARRLCGLEWKPDIAYSLSGGNLRVFQRNMELIKLPRDVKDLRMSPDVKLRLRNGMNDIRNMSTYTDESLENRAQELLALYECKAYTLEDFYG